MKLKALEKEKDYIAPDEETGIKKSKDSKEGKFKDKKPDINELKSKFLKKSKKV